MLSDYPFCAWHLSLFAIHLGYRVTYLVLIGVPFGVWRSWPRHPSRATQLPPRSRISRSSSSRSGPS